MWVKFVRQDQSTMSCGQACVAMLHGCSLIEAIENVGSGPTTLRISGGRYAIASYEATGSVATLDSRIFLSNALVDRRTSTLDDSFSIGGG